MGRWKIQNVSRPILFLGSRVFILYLVMFGLFYASIDYQVVMGKARAAALSRLVPSFEYLGEFMTGQGRFDEQKLKESIHYHRKVAQYVPVFRADAYGIMGLCYYQLGEHKKAISFFKDAAGLNPYFFWNQYNLGVAYFRDREYQKAVVPLNQAAHTSPEFMLKILNSSKVYLDILKTIQDPYSQVRKQIIISHSDVYVLLVACYYGLHNFEEVLNYAAQGVSLNHFHKDFFCFYAGLAAYQLKKYPESIRFLRECVEMNPKNLLAAYYLDLSLKEAGGRNQLGERIEDPEISQKNQDYLNQLTSRILPRIF